MTSFTLPTHSLISLCLPAPFSGLRDCWVTPSANLMTSSFLLGYSTPSGPCQCPGLCLGVCGRAGACTRQWHSNRAEITTLGENRLQAEVSLRHLRTLLADHKSWKCLMRSLYSGPGGWTPQAPSVADTSCHLPLDMQNKQVQAGRAALLDLTFSITLLAHPGPLGREDRTLPSFGAAPDPQGSAKRGPTSRGSKQLFTDTGGCGRVGRGKSNNSC